MTPAIAAATDTTMRTARTMRVTYTSSDSMMSCFVVQLVFQLRVRILLMVFSYSGHLSCLYNQHTGVRDLMQDG